MTSVQERVAKGVEFLDARRPTWRHDINTERLDLISFTHCVLGQLGEGYGGYETEAQRLGLVSAGREDEIAYGFFPAGDPGRSMQEDAAFLTAEWKRVLSQPQPTDVTVQDLIDALAKMVDDQPFLKDLRVFETDESGRDAESLIFLSLNTLYTNIKENK